MTEAYTLTIEYNGQHFVPDEAHTLLMQRLAKQAVRIEKLEHLVEMMLTQMPECIECGRQPAVSNDLLCDRCLTEYALWQERYGPVAYLFAETEDGTSLLPPVEASEEVSMNAEAVEYLFDLQPGAACVGLWWKPVYNQPEMTLLYTYDRHQPLPLSLCAAQEKVLVAE